MINELPRFVSNIEVIIKGLGTNDKIDILEPIKLPQVLDREKKLLENSFQNFLLSHHEKHYLLRITKKYHNTLLDLSNHVYLNISDLLISTKNVAEQNEPIKELYLKIVMVIEELLQSIIIESSEYFDDKLMASHYYSDLHSQSLQHKFIEFEKRLLKRHIDHSMISLLHNFFFSFNSHDRRKCSYHELDYAENLISHLIDALDLESFDKWNIILWEQLIKYNFNKLKTLEYAKKMLDQYSDMLNAPVKNYKFLILTLKMVKQVAVHSSWQYDKNDISLKTYLEAIIIEELSWLKKNNPDLINQFLKEYRRYFLIDATKEELNLILILNLTLNRIQSVEPYRVMEILSQFTKFIEPVNDTSFVFKSNLENFDIYTVKNYHEHLVKCSELLKQYYPNLNPIN